MAKAVKLNAFSPVVKSFKTFQDTNDPNSIAMVMEVSDVNKLNEIANDPNLQPLKEKHTVIEPIIISVEVAV